MKQVTRKYYQDPGHGWVAVKRKELVDLGIMHKITAFSYQRGATVYLEEDCDAGTYRDAMRGMGVDVNFKIIHTNNRSAIRSYDCFSGDTK